MQMTPLSACPAASSSVGVEGFCVSVHTAENPSFSVDSHAAAVCLPVVFPSYPPPPSSAGSSKLQLVFSSPRVTQFEHAAAGDSDSSRLTFRQTLVACGDFPVCPFRPEGSFAAFLSFLEKTEEACIVELSAATRKEWLDESVKRSDLSTHASGSLTSARRAYACRMYSAVSSLAEQGCICSCCSSSPTAFSLVLHSEAFGLLLFARDKLGRASLLLAGGEEEEVKGLPFALVTSAAALPAACKTAKCTYTRICEVPVDGIWVLDLWALAGRHSNSNLPLLPLKPTEEEKGKQQEEWISLSRIGAACIEWKKPSVIRGKHLWCSCESCHEFREAFWREEEEKESSYGFCIDRLASDILDSLAHPKSCTREEGSSLSSSCRSCSCSCSSSSSPSCSFSPSCSSCSSPFSSCSSSSPSSSACQVKPTASASADVDDVRVLYLLCGFLFASVCRSISEVLHLILSDFAFSKDGERTENPISVGILFSGGVDSSLIAAVVLRLLAAAMARASGVRTPGCLGVLGSSLRSWKQTPLVCKCSPPSPSFTNDRCLDISRESAEKKSSSAATQQQRRVVVELVSVCFSPEAPDRLTALRTFEDLLLLLQRLGQRENEQEDKNEEKTADTGCSSSSSSGCCVAVGHWSLELRLVCVDVSAEENAKEKSRLLKSICPKRSHMDVNIAAPLFFASRGSGYLVSSLFSQSKEWKTLKSAAVVWEELTIKPLNRPRVYRQLSEASRRCTYTSTDEECQRRGKKCKVCQRQAKEGCVHAACKLCCEKLRAAAAAAGEREQVTSGHAIYVCGQGMVHLSSVGITPKTSCSVHRSSRNQQKRETCNQCSNEPSNEQDGCSSRQQEGKKGRKQSRPLPFASLQTLPCGIPLATISGVLPFFAMNNEELSRWRNEGGGREEDCMDRETGSKTDG
ncbi:hypothetical protein Efla_005688 [Eimeria flavescens]